MKVQSTRSQNKGKHKYIFFQSVRKANLKQLNHFQLCKQKLGYTRILRILKTDLTAFLVRINEYVRGERREREINP